MNDTTETETGTGWTADAVKVRTPFAYRVTAYKCEGAAGELGSLRTGFHFCATLHERGRVVLTEGRYFEDTLRDAEIGNPVWAPLVDTHAEGRKVPGQALDTIYNVLADYAGWRLGLPVPLAGMTYPPEDVDGLILQGYGVTASADGLTLAERDDLAAGRIEPGHIRPLDMDSLGGHSLELPANTQWLHIVRAGNGFAVQQGLLFHSKPLRVAMSPTDLAGEVQQWAMWCEIDDKTAATAETERATKGEDEPCDD